ncbi:hypothetical protein [Burkholderia sp. MSh2]|uniref:hypothetical protein n=1 Tax=Burkholderia sp. MSh2 TaxID=1506588 RepID=UPI00126A074C|nr:hypothetical protein [Burkholderia sp. MSh2]
MPNDSLTRILIRAAMPGPGRSRKLASGESGPSRHDVTVHTGHTPHATPSILSTRRPIRSPSTERSMMPQTMPAIASMSLPARTAEDLPSLL